MTDGISETEKAPQNRSEEALNESVAQFRVLRPRERGRSRTKERWAAGGEGRER